MPTFRIGSIQTLDKMNKKRLPWIFLGTAIFSMVVAAVFFPEPSLLADLENRCSGYQTYLNPSQGLTGDFNRCSRARCTWDFFETIRTNYGFDKPFDSSKTIGWSSCHEAWWTPPGDNVYIKNSKDDTRELLAYKEGYVYYDISTW
ncbi:hypothetical protein JIN84_07300 [Luteolibacter yonseiensis]|uniref:Uncharacterized protein n=1 Tax=Luteolibacter yonseiensis TaxID=1144680 RepID=A0A934R3J0_9BACT|nr:hypothetical protein [Luteolibacter yonseiensis]MBK1815413.1 hypothetical protein [Luteolibacter yonseiensis]